MRLEVFVARKVGSLVGLGKNYNKMVPSVRQKSGGRKRAGFLKGWVMNSHFSSEKE